MPEQAGIVVLELVEILVLGQVEILVLGQVGIVVLGQQKYVRITTTKVRITYTNVWMGVSVEGQAATIQCNRVRQLQTEVTLNVQCLSLGPRIHQGLRIARLYH